MLSVRDLIDADIPLLLHYWFSAEPAFLQCMGVDVTRMPTSQEFANMLHQQINLPIQHRKSYCIIWLYNNEPIGHCNTNPTAFGKEATMHLHLWQTRHRRKGVGTQLVKQTLPRFFENLQLDMLWCEPYALNVAPNKTLEKIGFELIKEYTTTPGWINFEQPVKQWRMTRERYVALFQPGIE